LEGKKIAQAAINVDVYICRRWRENNHGRG